MPQRLDDLYQHLHQKQEYPHLRASIEENHKLLIEHLSKADRKIVLRIMDALDLICTMRAKDSFVQGFKLGVDLTSELQNYNDHSHGENALHDCGQFFMSDDNP